MAAAVEARATGVLDPRQLWNLPTSSKSSHVRQCTPFMLPSNGVLSFGDSVITLTTNVEFSPECTGQPTSEIALTSVMKDPFYASTIPQTYVIAATTVIAWILVTMLVITPRTNFIGQTSVSSTISRGHGIIGGSTGGRTNIIGVGSRPWLQKAAAFSVAIALTIATADMFKEADFQYDNGYMDANRLRETVLGSQEILITRVISDVLVWLAQVQTLVRLFPRHKEKVLIKWIGFCLIVFDTVFSCVNAFYVDGGSPTRPRRFVNAIPALSYLFELALGLLYAAWVVYYAISKRRYAFYHGKMKSISVIAVLSIVAICTPVVFFVIDVSNQDVAGWGDYFRWVGAAAASVVVWEWVERIEALERDDKKDGILGREVFDGDEMLDLMPTDEIVWNSSRTSRYRRGGGGGSSSNGGNASTDHEDRSIGIFTPRFRRKTKRSKQQYAGNGNSSQALSESTHHPNGNTNTKVSFADTPNHSSDSQRAVADGPTRPAPVASPINRADTSSAGSTVYVVRYDTITDVPQSVRRKVDASGNGEEARAHIANLRRNQAAARDLEREVIAEEDEQQPSLNRDQSRWHSVSNPFKRKRASPPTEVQKAKEAAAAAGEATSPVHASGRWNFKNRLGSLAGMTTDRTREHNTRQQDSGDVPVIVIPAQRRGSTHPTAITAPPRTTTPPRAAPHMGSRSSTKTPSPSSSQSVPENSPGRQTSTRPPRADDVSPLGAGGVPSIRTTPSNTNVSNVTSSRPTLAPRRPTFSSPPRADDISPAAGSTGPTVIPAPRRSPAKAMTPSADGTSSNP